MSPVKDKSLTEQVAPTCFSFPENVILVFAYHAYGAVSKLFSHFGNTVFPYS